jgi:hypothetical protein
LRGQDAGWHTLKVTVCIEQYLSWRNNILTVEKAAEVSEVDQFRIAGDAGRESREFELEYI